LWLPLVHCRKYGHRDRPIDIKGLHELGVLCSTTNVTILTHLSNYTVKSFLISVLLSWPFVYLSGTLMCIHVNESHWPLDRIMGQFDTAQMCTIFLKGTLFYRLGTVQIKFIPIYGSPYTIYKSLQHISAKVYMAIFRLYTQRPCLVKNTQSCRRW